MISIIALVFAMSGTAVAATGGDFILGKSNTATNVSSIGTYTLTQQYSSVTDSCYFTGQATVTNG